MIANARRAGALSAAALMALLLVAETAAAQFGFGFGQNKVQYRDFRWRVIVTEHFEVYYYEEERPAAVDAARMAERSYALLSRQLDHTIKEKVPLILYASHNDFQQTNAVGGLLSEGTRGVTESLKRRVILPITGSYADFTHVLTHELVHAFQFDILSGGGRARNPLRLSPPLWMVEGMAEHLSIGMDNLTRMWLRDAVRTGRLPTIGQLSTYQDIRVYRFGQAVWDFVERRFGEEAVGLVFKRYAYHGDLERAFRETLKWGTKELSDAWIADVKTSSAAPEGTVDPGQIARRLTRHGEYLYTLNLVPALSPDGERVAFVADKSLYDDIYLARATDGKILERLVKGGRSGDFESLRFLDTSLAWSRDGRSLAFVAKAGSRDALYLYDVEEGRVRARLQFDLSGLVSPSWSPDGEQIVFVGLDGGRSDLFVVRRDGSDLRRLTRDRFADLQPRWSPDGGTIAFVTDRGARTDQGRLLFADLNLALYHLDGGAIELLEDQPGEDLDPQWSGDGSQIAFLSDWSGIPNVYLLDLASRTVRPVTNLATGASGITSASPALSWAPAAGLLAFSAFGNGGWDIYVKEGPLTSVGVAAADTAPPQPDLRSRLAAVDMPDTTSFAFHGYRLDFSPDLLVGGVGFGSNVGLAGQSQIFISDMLGNHNFLLASQFFGSAANSDFLFSYINLAHRANYALSAFQFRNDFGLFTAPDSDTLEFVSQIYRGGEVLVGRPFDRFTRIELGLQAVAVSEKVVRQSFLTSEAVVEKTGATFYMNPSIALVRDNSLFGATGPIAGSRWRLSLDQAAGGLTFTTLVGDYRRYINIHRRQALAYRLIVGASFGGDRQIFRIGGPFTFRGTDYGLLGGTRVLIQNVEFRSPIFLWLPPTYDFLQWVVYWDMASAWDSDFRPFTSRGPEGFRLNDLIGAYGAGLRANIGYAVLRLDFARATDLRRSLGDTQTFFSIGTDF